MKRKPNHESSLDRSALVVHRACLALDPDGIDPLYFWGDHLFRQGHYAQAKAALDKALQTAPRPGRELADSGRRKDIQALLVDVNKKLK